MKKVIATLLALSFCFSFPVFASNVTDVAEDELPESTIEHIDYMFSNQENLQIIDEEGNDIAAEFFSRNAEKYENGDIRSIVKELGDQGLSIERTIIEAETPDGPVARAILWYTATKYVQKYFPNSNYYIEFTGEGRYSVNDSTGQITGASSPTIPFYNSNAGKGYETLCWRAASSSYSINAAKTTVTFNLVYTAELYVAGGAMISAIPNTTVTFYGYV